MGRISSQKRKNYIINGDMQIAQRGTSFVALAANNYTLDRWTYQKSGSMVHTVSQSSDGPTDTQSGYQFVNSLDLNLTTADTSIAAGDYCSIGQRIEGYNLAQFARQKPFTISFWVKATVTGTYCVALRNGGADRSYVAEYTINSSNTWEYKTIVIKNPTPTSGTWNYTNGIGLFLDFVIAGGSTFQTTPGSWQTGNFFSTANQVNGVNTGATDFRITGVMLNEGFNAQPFKTYGDNFDAEVIACQRFYEKSYDLTVNPGTNGSQPGAFVTPNQDVANNGTICTVFYNVRKRSTPTCVLYGLSGTINTISNGGGTDLAANSGTAGFIGTRSFRAFNNSGGSLGTNNFIFHYTIDAEL